MGTMEANSRKYRALISSPNAPEGSGPPVVLSHAAVRVRGSTAHANAVALQPHRLILLRNISCWRMLMSLRMSQIPRVRLA